MKNLHKGNPNIWAGQWLRAFQQKILVLPKSLGGLMALLSVVLFFALAANGDTTNGLADSEIDGRALAQKILGQCPTGNFTNTGVLQIRDSNGKRTDVPIKVEVRLTIAGWVNVYDNTKTVDSVTNAFVQIAHRDGPNLYWSSDISEVGARYNSGRPASPTEPYASSDFSLGDLGLEFFHWPQQKVLKKEFHRQCACVVLESTNPNPGTNGYSRVVCWIDEDSLGIVEAYAYDVRGQKLKNFYPKDFKKVKGQYQVQSLIMDNLQTGSRSRLEFDLEK
jgi:hypothetical protein